LKAIQGSLICGLVVFAFGCRAGHSERAELVPFRGDPILQEARAVPRSPADSEPTGFEQLRIDLRSAPKGLWRDAKGTFTRKSVLIPLAVVGGVAAVLKGNLDTKDTFRDHEILSSAANDAGDLLGTGAILIGGAAGLYAYSLAGDDEHAHEASKSLFGALAVTGASTLLLKQVVHAKRPTGSRRAFPSGHSSMAMTTAAVLEESYGWGVGIPAYALVGLQRLDSESHDVADVLFGLTLGYVVGKSVSDVHAQERRYSLYADPELGRIGITLHLHD
jgi:hypothetical protein